MNKTMFDFENNTKIASESFCDNKKKQAYLVLDYAPKGESKGYFVLINITGVRLTCASAQLAYLFIALLFCNPVDTSIVMVI